MMGPSDVNEENADGCGAKKQNAFVSLAASPKKDL